MGGEYETSRRIRGGRGSPPGARKPRLAKGLPASRARPAPTGLAPTGPAPTGPAPTGLAPGAHPWEEAAGGAWEGGAGGAWEGPAGGKGPALGLGHSMSLPLLPEIDQHKRRGGRLHARPHAELHAAPRLGGAGHGAGHGAGAAGGVACDSVRSRSTVPIRPPNRAGIGLARPGNPSNALRGGTQSALPSRPRGGGDPELNLWPAGAAGPSCCCSVWEGKEE